MKTTMSARIMIVAGAALLVLLLPACRKSPVGATVRPAPKATAPLRPVALAPGDFVTSAGVWAYEDEQGQAELTATLTRSGVEWVLRASGQESPVHVMNPKGSDPWFIYLAGPREVWAYDGREDLSHAVMNADGSVTHELARGTSEFHFDPKTKAPQTVLDRLPEPMRKLIPVAPASAPKPVRPSI